MYGHPYDCPPWCPYCRAASLGGALDPATVKKNVAAFRALPPGQQAARKYAAQKQMQRARSRATKRVSGSGPGAQAAQAYKASGGKRRFQPSRMLRPGAGRRFGRGGRKLAPMRFSRIRGRLARRLGLKIYKTQSGYSYPQIPQQVEQGIPNYYAESREARMLEPIPQEESTFARKMGRFIFEQLPEDPDRGETVEETIANVLDFAANRALAAGDQENADQLIKISKKWRQSIGKKEAAIDPDAPIEANDDGDGETGVLDILRGPANLSPRNALIAAGSAAAAYFIALKKMPYKGRDPLGQMKKAGMVSAATLFGASILLNAIQKKDGE